MTAIDKGQSVPATRLSTLAGTGCMLLSALGYGSMPLLAKLGYANGMTVTTLLVTRFVAGTLILWLWLAASRRIQHLKPHTTLSLFLLGIWLVANSATFFLALVYLPVATVALIGSVTPAVVTAAAAVFLRERLTRARLLALVLAISGGILIVGMQSSNLNEASLFGIILTVLNIISYSGYVLFSSRVVQNVAPDMGAVLVVSGAACCYCLYAALSGSFQIPTQAQAWLLIAALGFFSTVFGLLGYLAGVGMLGASRATIIGNMEPVISVALAALVLGEAIALQHIIGGALIMIALLLLNLNGLIALSKHESLQQ